MAKDRRLVNKLKRRKNYLNRNRGFDRQDKIDLNDETLARSSRAYHLMRGVERRLDRKFGIQLVPSPDKILIEHHVIVNDLDRFDFDPGAGVDYGVRLRMDIVLAGVAEQFTVTVPATASAAQADYLYFVAPNGSLYAVWLDIDANGTVPTGNHYVNSNNKVMVSIVTGNTAVQNAAALVSALGVIPNLTILDNLDGTVTFTYNSTGARQDAVTYNASDSGAGSMSAVINVQGVTQINNEILAYVGARVGDIIEIGTGALKGARLAVVAVIDANTLRLEDDARLTAPETQVSTKFKVSGSKKSYS